MKIFTYILGLLITFSCQAENLPKIQKAPNFVGIDTWLNSQPLELSQLTGKVVLVDFWSYSCINCIRTFPYLIHWYETYKDKGFVIIGVHSPEFAFEKERKNVEEAIKRFKIPYPVALDNKMDTWRAYSNQYWPASYLIDQQGIIRKKHFGEGGYLEMENAIRTLLDMPAITTRKTEEQRIYFLSQEAYLGYLRADRYNRDVELQPNQKAMYRVQETLKPEEIGLKGLWQIGPESITAEASDSQLHINFLASRVFLVMSGQSPEPVIILLDNMPMPKEYYTQDMDTKGQIFLDGDRKYDLINMHGKVERHTLTIHLPKNISAYAFTFGAEN